MTFNKGTDIFTIMPEKCAEGILNDLGFQDASNGYWTHKLQAALSNAVPEKFFMFLWQKFIAPDFMKDRVRLQKKSTKN